MHTNLEKHATSLDLESRVDSCIQIIKKDHETLFSNIGLQDVIKYLEQQKIKYNTENTLSHFLDVLIALHKLMLLAAYFGYEDWNYIYLGSAKSDLITLAKLEELILKIQLKIEKKEYYWFEILENIEIIRDELLKSIKLQNCANQLVLLFRNNEIDSLVDVLTIIFAKIFGEDKIRSDLICNIKYLINEFHKENKLDLIFKQSADNILKYFFLILIGFKPDDISTININTEENKLLKLIETGIISENGELFKFFIFLNVISFKRKDRGLPDINEPQRYSLSEM